MTYLPSWFLNGIFYKLNMLKLYLLSIYHVYMRLRMWNCKIIFDWQLPNTTCHCICLVMQVGWRLNNIILFQNNSYSRYNHGSHISLFQFCCFRPNLFIVWRIRRDSLSIHTSMRRKDITQQNTLCFIFNKYFVIFICLV